MLGIHFQYYPTQKHFNDFLKDKPNEVKEYELRKITSSIRDANNHKLYHKLLEVFIPKWLVNIERKKFIGKGFSESSLKTFRKVTIEDKIYFEKVYFNSYPDFQTVQWFQDHIYSITKNTIKVPPVLKMYSGEILTVLYFEFLELVNLKEQDREENFVKLSKDLYQLSEVNKKYLDNLELPISIKDFRTHFWYKKFVQIASEKLKNKEVDLKVFEEEISLTKRVLTHGDIFEGNCFQNSILIDWDSFGLYPIGFDPAFIFHRLLVRNGKTNDVFRWLKLHYENIISEDDWDEFEQNFTYFLFIFATNTFNKGLFREIEEQLMLKIKSSNICKKI